MGNPYEPLSNASDNLKNDENPEEVVETVETVEENKEENSNIPEGNITELKEWVGEDKDRAQLLLDEENSHESPRKTLVKHLEEVING